MVVKGTKIKVSEGDLRLWEDFKRTKSSELKEKLVRKYYYIVRYISEKYLERLPKSVQLDDLISSGLYGLLISIDRYDLSKGYKFESFCVKRIHGAILDDLRNIDWLPRAARQRTNRLIHAYETLEKRLGRPSTDVELAQELGISLKDLADMYHDYNAATLYSFQNFNNPADDEVGIVQFEDKKIREPIFSIERKDMLGWVKKNLTTKERHIVLMYYSENMTFKEIARVLDITESRVSQLHARVLLKLRSLAKKERIA